MLLIFSVLGIVALFIGMTTTGMISVYAITSVGLFCSTLWPCIFALSVRGLGKHTSQGVVFNHDDYGRWNYKLATRLRF